MNAPNPTSAYFPRLTARVALLLCFPNPNAAADSLYDAWKNVDPPAVYQGQYLTGIDFPIGAVGGSVIRM